MGSGAVERAKSPYIDHEHTRAPREARRRTARSILSAASSTLSCSQTLMTIQPTSRRRRSVSRSRDMFASIFARHQPALFFGQVPCSGQPCQKQPSMKTAVLEPGNTMSTVLRLSANSRHWRRKRRPRRCSSERRARSPGLSLCRVRDIRLLVFAETGSEGSVGTAIFDMMLKVNAKGFLVPQCAPDQSVKESAGSLS